MDDLDSIGNLLQALTKELQIRNLTIATAESCTGGLIASFLTELPGSSAWFDRGFVTYSNISKRDMLGVDIRVIEQYGAVSDVVAKSMALGALEHSTATVSLAVTGIAGPGGSSPQKPIGTVYFAYAKRGKMVQSEHYHFSEATRQQIRLLACRKACQGMLSYIYTAHTNI